MYAIDLDLLEECIGELAGFERSLERALTRLESPIRALDGAWTGSAAEAHRKAHRAWVSEAAAMRTALAGLLQAARVAHRNYHAATAANVTMWESTR